MSHAEFTEYQDQKFLKKIFPSEYIGSSQTGQVHWVESPQQSVAYLSSGIDHAGTGGSLRGPVPSFLDFQVFGSFPANLEGKQMSSDPPFTFWTNSKIEN